MKVKLLNKSNTETGKKDLPEQFYEPVRQDLIKRAVLSLQAAKRQAYGAMEGAGMRHSAELSRRRRKYRGSYGFGISRVQRKILSRRGTRFNWAGAVIPGTVGGRRAHPPKAEKKLELKINIKERRKAIRSAIAASAVKEIVQKRGHKVPAEYPFVVGSDFEALEKTKDMIQSLGKLGFKEELERTSETATRPGRGKLRGRKKIQKKGILLVVAERHAPAIKAARGIAGVDAVFVKGLNVELLAPGAHPGRLTLFTEAAIDILAKEKLFTKNYKAASKTSKAIEEKK